MYSYNNDDTYEGDWKEGMRDGQGVYHYANGDTYEGEWLRNHKHGTGNCKTTL